MSCRFPRTPRSILGRLKVRLGALLLSSFMVPALGTSLIASTAQAADESPETEALLRRGIQLRREGADEAALAVFLEAEAQSPNSVRVLLHVATAAQAASKWLMADEYLRKATQHDNDSYYQRYRAEIEEVRAATSQRVGQFRAVGSPEGAEVVLNGRVIGTLPMETPKSVEAGTYVLEVSKPGYYRLRRPISVPGAVLTRETVDLNVRTAAGGDGPDESLAGRVGADSGAQQADWYQQRWVTWSLFGVGAAAGVTSGISLFLRERAADHWNDEGRCLDGSDPSSSRLEECADVRNDIDTAEQVAIISGGLGVVFMAGALAHWLATSGDDSSASAHGRGAAAKAAGEFSCSPGMMNILCKGTF